MNTRTECKHKRVNAWLTYSPFGLHSVLPNTKRGVFTGKYNCTIINDAAVFSFYSIKPTTASREKE